MQAVGRHTPIDGLMGTTEESTPFRRANISNQESDRTIAYRRVWLRAHHSTDRYLESAVLTAEAMDQVIGAELHVDVKALVEVAHELVVAFRHT